MNDHGNSNAETAVINLSLGGGYTATVNAAIDAATEAGILSVCASGNDGNAMHLRDACNSSPAGAATAFTVAAIGIDDAPADFSKIGTCFDVWAPGVNIMSACTDNDTSSEDFSGTSMAAPHGAAE